MLPYADDTKTFSPPIWILILIIANVVVFVLSYTAGFEHYIRTIFSYGTIPARFFTSDDSTLQYGSVISEYMINAGVEIKTFAPPIITLFSSMFLHGGWFHLIGNMWFLWLFGDNVEDRLGKFMFPIFYIVCGLIAGIMHVMFQHDSTIPAVGASGAIAGVMGAYIYMFPRSTIRTLMGWRFYFRTTSIPAIIYLGLWFLLQLLGGFAESGSNIAFMAHIGGFLGGLVFAALLQGLKKITWYPGDRFYSGLDFLHKPVKRGRVAGTGSTPRHTPPSTGTRRKRRYTWRE